MGRSELAAVRVCYSSCRSCSVFVRDRNDLSTYDAYLWPKSLLGGCGCVRACCSQHQYSNVTRFYCVVLSCLVLPRNTLDRGKGDTRTINKLEEEVWYHMGQCCIMLQIFGGRCFT